MKTYKFKTNINCSGCIEKITPFFDKFPEGTTWDANTNHKDKILTIKSAELTEQQIIETVKEAGFRIEPLKKGLFGKLF